VTVRVFFMLFLTRLFGVTGSEAERNLGAERAYTEEIVERILLMQANAAAKQHRPLGRGTHAKGVTARAQFEVFDVTVGRDHALAARLAKGIFSTPGVYPATVRFANSDPQINSDAKADVRSLSFSVDLTRNGTAVPAAGVERQDFSLQNATTLPINDALAFLATMKLLTASNPAKGLWSLSLQDKLRVVRTLVLAQLQARQPVKPLSTTSVLEHRPVSPRVGGCGEAVGYTVPRQSFAPLAKKQFGRPAGRAGPPPRGRCHDESFDFGLQFLDTGRMTYWGKRRDASFWIENASVEWKEAQAPFRMVARLTLIPKSQLSLHASEATYFDVTGNSAPDSAPVGSINRARWPAEVASRQARMRADTGSA
jgi:hypothetical protein